MFFSKCHYMVCQTFDKDNFEVSNNLKKLLEYIKSRLEELNYRAVIISVIK